MEVIFDLATKRIMSQVFLDMGFSPAKATDPTVKAVDEFLMNTLERYALGEKVEVLKREKREVEGKGEVKVYYEFENNTVFARVFFDGDNLTLLHLEDLDSKLAELREENLRETEELRRAVRRDPEFQELEDLLFQL